MEQKQRRVRAGQRSRVVDVRGREHALCTVEDLSEDAGAELIEAVRKGNVHRWPMRVAAAIVGIVAAAIMLALIHWIFALRFRASSVGGVVGALIAGVFVAQRSAAAAGRAAEKACLQAQVCPGCGYSLRGLEAERDGARVCPECGGAWKVG